MDHDPDTAPTVPQPGDEATREPVADDRSLSEIESTGIDAVDQVLVDVAAVATAPVGDHVQVFERAHEQLRRALDAPPPTAPDDERGA